MSIRLIFLAALALISSGVMGANGAKSQSNSVSVGSHCQIEIPDDYRLALSNDEEASYYRNGEKFGAITIRKGDYSSYFLQADTYRESGWSVSGDTVMAVYRIFDGSGQPMETFRIVFVDVSVGVTGEDAARYARIVGKCLPADLAGSIKRHIVKIVPVGHPALND